MSQAVVNSFNDGQNNTISYSNVNVFNNTGSGLVQINNEVNVGKGLSRLYKALKNCAGHTIGRPDAAVPCLPETRKSARVKINEWKHKQIDRTARSELMWVTGPAGCGKTSVAESTCLAFEEKDLLVIDCFFSYSIGRTNSKYLCLTLAYQLATSTISKAVLGPLIEAVVTDDRSILDASVETQFQRLILEPIEKAGAAIPIVFVVVDGLDECGTVEDSRELFQTQILRLFEDTISRNSLPIRFLVSSRPEIWIRRTLLSPSALRISMISLEQNEEANTDIRLFYLAEFNRIRNDPEFQSTPFPSSPTWPSKDDIDTLVDNACGQFVYAKTITRFLSEPYHPQSPVFRLASVLRRNSNPTLPTQFEHLDNLYSLILSFSAHQETLSILGSIRVGALLRLGREWLSILEVLWDLGQGASCNLLRHSHSVVFVPPDLTATRETTSPAMYSEIVKDTTQRPRFYHKSFTDFLHDPQRAGKFYVDLQEINCKLAIGCLRVLQNVSSSPRTRLHAVTWYHAYHYWDDHCRNIGNLNKGTKPLLNALNSFQFTSHYLVYHKIVGHRWKMMKKFPLLYLIEKRDSHAEGAMRDLHSILHTVCEDRAFGYTASSTWRWVKTQTAIEPLAFLKLRFKLWYLHKVANEAGWII